MIPQLAAVRGFVELGNAHAMLVGRHTLGHDVHGYLAQVEVAADAGGGGDARLAKHLLDHLLGKLVGGEAVFAQVLRGVDENFVDGIDVDVVGSDITQVDVVDARTIAYVQPHARRRHMVGDHPVGMRRQQGGIGRLGGHDATTPTLPLVVEGADALDHLEQTRPTRQSIGFQRRGDSQADGLLRARGIGHNQMRGQRVETPLHTLDRGVERLEVDGYIGAALRHVNNDIFKTPQTQKYCVPNVVAFMSRKICTFATKT